MLDNTDNTISLGADNHSSLAATTMERDNTLEQLGETLGEFKPYDAQLTIPEISGTRIVKCLYQTSSKTGKKVAENSYVRVPTKHLTEELVVAKISELVPYAVSWLQGIEDAGIKHNHSRGMLTVHTQLLSLDLLIEKLEENETGARLNKEKIEAWFTSEMERSLVLLACDKMGINDDATASTEQIAKLDIVLNAYKAKFASLAGGKTYIKPEECQSMISVITKCEADTSLLGSRFVARLTKMMDKEDEMLLSL